MEVLATLVFVVMGLLLAVVMKQRNELRLQVEQQKTDAARANFMFDFAYGQWEKEQPQAEAMMHAYIDMGMAQGVIK